MLSIVGLTDDVLEGICKKALSQAPEGSVCQIANFLFPQVPLLSICICPTRNGGTSRHDAHRCRPCNSGHLVAAVYYGTFAGHRVAAVYHGMLTTVHFRNATEVEESHCKIHGSVLHCSVQMAFVGMLLSPQV